MAKQYRIRVRGKQRDDMDLELFAQALLMIVEDLEAEQQRGQAADGEPSQEHDS